jgi:hypothetical protein
MSAEILQIIFIFVSFIFYITINDRIVPIRRLIVHHRRCFVEPMRGHWSGPVEHLEPAYNLAPSGLFDRNRMNFVPNYAIFRRRQLVRRNSIVIGVVAAGRMDCSNDSMNDRSKLLAILPELKH